jgi:BirA family biotin operon repressor/biotin-[acetyl-CoA-carboxylase] ligase
LIEEPVTTDTKILTALRTASEHFVTRAELAQQLGISASAVRQRIEILRGLGYEIEASPHLGYCLHAVPDVLHAEDLLSRLGKVKVVGRDIQVFQETTSSSDVVERLARDGVEEGVAVFAESQTRGRGRLGRRWLSPPGKGLWFSVLLRPRIPLESATRLTIVSATALARTIRAVTDLRADIKWPNDVLVHGKKVAGVLTELNAELDKINYIILGIGVDVNLTATDLPADLRKIASSLRLECGRELDRAELASTLLRELDKDYARVAGSGFEALADEWERQCTTLGQEVVIQMGHRKLRGRAESLDLDGALLLRTPHGHLERITGGDVTVEKGQSNDPSA